MKYNDPWPENDVCPFVLSYTDDGRSRLRIDHHTDCPGAWTTLAVALVPDNPRSIMVECPYCEDWHEHEIPLTGPRESITGLCDGRGYNVSDWHGLLPSIYQLWDEAFKAGAAS